MSTKSFLKPKYKAVEIETAEGKETLHFYPVRLEKLWKMRKMAKSLFQAFTFFTENSYATNTYRTTKDGDAVSTVTEPITIELLAALDDRRAKAVQEITEALLDPENVLTISELILDSLRENDYAMDAKTFSEQLDLQSFVNFAMGLIEANLAVFGPLGQKLSARLKGVSGETPAVAPGAGDAKADDNNQNKN